MSPDPGLIVDAVVNGRKPKWYQVLLQAVLPIIITTLLVWAANRVHEMDKTLGVVVHMVADTNKRVTTFDEKLESHSAVTQRALDKNSELHHTREMRVPCTGCHLSK
jgi:hypothetical protein